MTTFTATFSNGKTVTRTSHHPYRFAVALIHKTTGTVSNIRFTASDQPAANWEGFELRRNGPGISQG